MIRPVVFPVCHTRGLDGSGCRVSCKKNKTVTAAVGNYPPLPFSHQPERHKYNAFLNRFLSIFNLDFNEMVSR